MTNFPERFVALIRNCKLIVYTTWLPAYHTFFLVTFLGYCSLWSQVYSVTFLLIKNTIVYCIVSNLNIVKLLILFRRLACFCVMGRRSINCTKWWQVVKLKFLLRLRFFDCLERKVFRFDFFEATVLLVLIGFVLRTAYQIQILLLEVNVIHF